MRTWVAGEVVTAAVGNSAWRDNLSYLKTQQDLDDTHRALTSTAHGGIAWTAWVPTLNGGSAVLSGYTTARYKTMGNVCFFEFSAENKNVGGSAGDLTISLPVAVGASAGYTSFVNDVYDGAAWVGKTHCVVTGGDVAVQVKKTAAAGTWAGTENGVFIRVSGFYEI